MKIILKTWFNTGLGDFYACLLSTKIAQDNLKKLGFETETIIDFSRPMYGKTEQEKLLDKCFDLSYFDSVKFNCDIPSNYFIHEKSAKFFAFEIYYPNKEVCELLDETDLFGYSFESFVKGVPYPNKTYRENILLRDDFLHHVETMSKDFEDFTTIFYRFHDEKYVVSNFELENIMNRIRKVQSIHNYSNIFISSKINQIKEIKEPGLKIVDYNYEVKSLYDRVERDLVNMTLLMYSKKIYYLTYTWSNYLTFPLIHNKLNLNHKDFLIEIESI